MRTFMLFMMLFCHILDDFYLQGPLAGMKQARWWANKILKMSHDDPREKMRLETLYRYDYVVCLFLHAFSWTFVMQAVPMLVMIFTKHEHVVAYIIAFIINMIVHAIVDNFKANHQTINLVVDQAVHVGQVILTWLTFFIFIDVYVR